MSLQIITGATGTNSPPANVSASAAVTTVAGSAIVDGETFTIQNELGTFVFEFDSNSSVVATDVRIQVVFSGASTATQVAAALVAAINASVCGCTATNSSANVTVTRTGAKGIAGNGGALSDTVADAGFTHANSFTGGVLAGHSLRKPRSGFPSQFWRNQDRGSIQVNYSGSGTMTLSARLWGFAEKLNRWIPMGSSSTMASRGLLNFATTLAEDGADQVMQSEPISGLSSFTRIYLEIVSIGGTPTSVDAWLVDAEGV